MSERTRLPAEVLIMAGGLGSRLGELTSTTPKPMLPLDGKPILQHLLEHLRDQGVRHVFLSVRYLSHTVMDYFGDGRWLGVDVDYLEEDRPLDTAGAISLVPVSDAPLLVVNGDLLATIPCASLLETHLGRRAAMTVCHVEHRVSVPFGVLTCGDSDDVVALEEKPAVSLTVIAGVYVVAPKVVVAVPTGRPLCMPELIASLVRTGESVVGFRLPGPWLDIGSPEAYRQAADLLGERRSASSRDWRVAPRGRGEVQETVCAATVHPSRQGRFGR